MTAKILSAAAWLRLAAQWRRLGRFAAAERSYRWARRGASADEASRGVAGAALMMLRQGKVSKLRRFLETWIAMRPQDARAPQNLLLLLGTP